MKDLRKEKFEAVIQEFIESLPEEHEYDEFLIGKYYHDIQKEAVRNQVLDTNKRLDGRKLDEVRKKIGNQTKMRDTI